MDAGLCLAGAGGPHFFSSISVPSLRIAGVNFSASTAKSRHLEAHVVLGDVDEADGALAERAEIEGQPVAAPGFLADGEKGGIVRSRGGEAGLDAAARLLASEAVRNGNDQRSRQSNLRECEASYGDAAQPRQPHKGRDRSAVPLDVSGNATSERSSAVQVSACWYCFDRW